MRNFGFVLLLTVLLFSASPVMSAQDNYSEYLEKARKRLESGDILRATQNYEAYKSITGKTDSELERRLYGGSKSTDTSKKPATKTTTPSQKPATNGNFNGNKGAVASKPRNLTLNSASPDSTTTSSMSSDQTPPSVKTDYTESAYGIDMEMVYVQGGEFLMGGTSEQGSDAGSDEQVIRRVTVGDFYIGRFEVTQAQWEAVMGTSVSQQRNKDNPESSLYGTGPNYPMYYVSWEEASEFCRILSRKTGRTYRLPTEAEWEYAARGGQKSDRTKYSGSHLMDYAGWYAGNSSSSTHPVGTKSPNELGICDMSGNVWEWCRDWYSNYDPNQTDNPTGPVSGSCRVLRGGSWDHGASCCRVSIRNYDSSGYRLSVLGFRIVCLPSDGSESSDDVEITIVRKKKVTLTL